MRRLSEPEYRSWAAKFRAASTAVGERDELSSCEVYGVGEGEAVRHVTLLRVLDIDAGDGSDVI